MKTSILALAIALAFSFTATPAAGGLSNQTKCDSGKLLAAAKFSQCRIKVDFIALKKGDKLSAEKKTAMEDKCDTKINEAFVKLEEKYPDAGDDKCSTYGDAANMIAGLVAVSDAVADGSVSTGGSGAVDPTANDQAICEDANGTWESGTCTAGSSYNCTIGAMCSYWAAEDPYALQYYTNNYVGHTAETTGCPIVEWTTGTQFAEFLACSLLFGVDRAVCIRVACE